MRYRRDVTISIAPLWVFRLEQRCLAWLERRSLITPAWRDWPLHPFYRVTVFNGPVVCEGE